MVGLLMMLAISAQAAPYVVDDFASNQPNGWQLSGSPDYYKGGFGAKGVTIEPNALAGKPAMRAPIHIPADASTPAVWLTKPLPNLSGLFKWERLTFRYKLTSTRGLESERGLVCRFRTSPTTFTDIPFASPRGVRSGVWQEATIAFGKTGPPINIYSNYFNSIKELTFRFGGVQGQAYDGEFWVSEICLHAKAPDDWSYQPRITPRPTGSLRRALVITHSAASFYFVREALEAMKVKVDRRLFRGLHFPIFGFPATEKELFGYDVVALVDVDPYVLTRQQVEWLCDYVASGGGLLFAGGPTTLGAAKVFPPPLTELLPVTFDEGREMVTVNAPPQSATPHLITNGFAKELERVTKGHALKVKPDSTLLLRAGVATPTGWGMYTGGNWDDGVLSLSDDAHSGKHSAMLTTRKFYVDPATGKPTFIGLKLMQGDSNGYDGSRAYTAKPSMTYHFAFWLKGDAPGVKVHAVSWKTDEARADDREELGTTLGVVKPPHAWQRYEGSFTTAAATRRFALAFYVSGGPPDFPLGTKILVDDVEITEGNERTNLATNPGAEEDASVPILTTGAYHRGRVALLDGYPEVGNTTDNCFFTTGEYRTLLARTCQWLSGQQPTARNLPGYAPLNADFPPAQPLDRAKFYPIISWIGTEGGGQLLDERGLRERVDDLWEHGFNTVALGGVRDLGRQPLTNEARLRDYAVRYAQSRGMAVMFEYEQLTDLNKERPPTLCVFSPSYREELAKQIVPKLEAGKRYERALCIKILDEPTATDVTIDHCDLCQREFQQRFGRLLRKRSEIPANDREGQRQLNQFIADYVATGYQTIRQIADEARIPFGLLLTYMSTAFGYYDNSLEVEDAYGWSKAADYMDFDVYPYFYPASQRIRMVTAHDCFAVQRVIAEHTGKPAGFYNELDDRNYPMQINPIDASAECAWTAVGQGCRYLNSFINVAFSTGSGARPERWDCLGRELKKIREAGSLLLRTRKAPSSVALYFPQTQWMSGGTKFAPAYAYQLFLRVFGECDIAHEQVIAERGTFGAVKVLVVVDTNCLPDTAAARLVAFVSSGGWLLCDETAKLPAGLSSNPRVIHFRGSLDQRYREAVERPDSEARAELMKQVGEAMRFLRRRISGRRAQRSRVPSYSSFGYSRRDTIMPLFSSTFSITRSTRRTNFVRMKSRFTMGRTRTVDSPMRFPPRTSVNI